MEQEDKLEFVQYLSDIPARYFGSETRIKKRGWIFRRQVLEYKNNEKWVNVFNDSGT